MSEKIGAALQISRDSGSTAGMNPTKRQTESHLFSFQKFKQIEHHHSPVSRSGNSSFTAGPSVSREVLFERSVSVLTTVPKPQPHGWRYLSNAESLASKVHNSIPVEYLSRAVPPMLAARRALWLDGFWQPAKSDGRPPGSSCFLAESKSGSPQFS
jgi:hypothetical protein